MSRDETKQFAGIAAGTGLIRDWVDAKLESIGVEYVD